MIDGAVYFLLNFTNTQKQQHSIDWMHYNSSNNNFQYGMRFFSFSSCEYMPLFFSGQ